MEDTQYDRQAARLAGRLRELRRDSGLSAVALGKKLDLSQSTISRYETGATIPSTNTVRQLSVALGANDAAQAELVEMARALGTEFNSWRMVFRDSAQSHEQEIAKLEAETVQTRTFQHAVIPGLLQTAEYARQMLSRFNAGTSGRAELGTPEALSCRLERQGVLFDESKRFDFLISEWALRSQVCEFQTLRIQWDRILSLSTLVNVDTRILPLGADCPIVPANSFVLFDDAVAIIESQTAQTLVHDERDIATYRSTFDTLMSVAMSADESRAFLQELLTGEPRSASLEGRRVPGVKASSTRG